MPIQSAGLLVIDERERILLVAKNHAKIKMPKGYVYQTVGFPKGGVDPGDKSKRAAGIREVLEETGAHIGQLFIPKRKELITFTNYKMGDDGMLDMDQPKEVHMFGAFTTQKNFVPPDIDKHPFARLTRLEKFDKHVENPYERQAMETVAVALLEMRGEVMKAIRKKKMKMFV